MQPGSDSLTRGAFLRRLGAVAVLAAAWRPAALPAAARGARRGLLPHPEPRPGVTADHVLAEAKLPRKPKVRAAFAAARAHPAIFDGLYCACNCRDTMGHRSLLACFECDQAIGCLSCRQQAVLVGRAARAGKSLAEIRKLVDEEYG